MDAPNDWDTDAPNGCDADANGCCSGGCGCCECWRDGGRGADWLLPATGAAAAEAAVGEWLSFSCSMDMMESDRPLASAMDSAAAEAGRCRVAAAAVAEPMDPSDGAVSSLQNSGRAQFQQRNCLGLHDPG